MQEGSFTVTPLKDPITKQEKPCKPQNNTFNSAHSALFHARTSNYFQKLLPSKIPTPIPYLLLAILFSYKKGSDYKF